METERCFAHRCEGTTKDGKCCMDPKLECPYYGTAEEEKICAPDDPVNHPAHYTSGKVECIDAIECATRSYSNAYHGFLIGQVIKYLWRAPLKGKYKEDAEKASWYLNRLIEDLKGE